MRLLSSSSGGLTAGLSLMSCPSGFDGSEGDKVIYYIFYYFYFYGIKGLFLGSGHGEGGEGLGVRAISG